MTFLIFGAVLLLPVIETIDGTSVVYSVLSLTVIRMLPSPSRCWARAHGGRLSASWAGLAPVASLIVFAAIVVEEADLATHKRDRLDDARRGRAFVLAHGVSASPLVRRYVAWYESHPRERALAMESVTAADHRWRHPVRPDSRGTQR